MSISRCHNNYKYLSMNFFLIVGLLLLLYSAYNVFHWRSLSLDDVEYRPLDIIITVGIALCFSLIGIFKYAGGNFAVAQGGKLSKRLGRDSLLSAPNFRMCRRSKSGE